MGHDQPLPVRLRRRRLPQDDPRLPPPRRRHPPPARAGHQRPPARDAGDGRSRRRVSLALCPRSPSPTSEASGGEGVGGGGVLNLREIHVPPKRARALPLKGGEGARTPCPPYVVDAASLPWSGPPASQRRTRMKNRKTKGLGLAIV